MAKQQSPSAKLLNYQEAVLLGFLIAIQREKEVEKSVDIEGYFLFSICYASGNLQIAKKRVHKTIYALRDHNLVDIKFLNDSPQMYCKVRPERLEELAIC